MYIPAKFAVYEETMMRVKNHHMPATILVEIALVVMWGNTKHGGRSQAMKI